MKIFSLLLLLLSASLSSAENKAAVECQRFLTLTQIVHAREVIPAHFKTTEEFFGTQEVILIGASENGMYVRAGRFIAEFYVPSDRSTIRAELLEHNRLMPGKFIRLTQRLNGTQATTLEVLQPFITSLFEAYTLDKLSAVEILAQLQEVLIGHSPEQAQLLQGERESLLAVAGNSRFFMNSGWYNGPYPSYEYQIIKVLRLRNIDNRYVFKVGTKTLHATDIQWREDYIQSLQGKIPDEIFYQPDIANHINLATSSGEMNVYGYITHPKRTPELDLEMVNFGIQQGYSHAEIAYFLFHLADQLILKNENEQNKESLSELFAFARKSRLNAIQSRLTGVYSFFKRP